MMRQAYLTLLRFYPADHREIFAPEMLDTFDQAAADVRKRGFAASVWFTTRELLGLLRGLVKERIAKWTGRDRDLIHEPHDLPADATEAQARLRGLITRMEFAIANHDFPRARFYSDKERIMREQLRRLTSTSDE